MIVFMAQFYFAKLSPFCRFQNQSFCLTTDEKTCPDAQPNDTQPNDTQPCDTQPVRWSNVDGTNVDSHKVDDDIRSTGLVKRSIGLASGRQAPYLRLG